MNKEMIQDICRKSQGCSTPTSRIVKREVVRTPRPTPQFFSEKNYSTKKERGATPQHNYPPKPPTKSAPPISRIFAQRDLNKAQAVSFKTSDHSLRSPVYDEALCSQYFDQCFKVETRIGVGSFGEVFKVKSSEDGEVYAVKRSRVKFRGESDRKRRLEEVQKHETLPKHPNCVDFVKAWEEYQHLFIQTELCKMSLSTYAEKNHSISEKMVWNFLVDMLMALKHLHDHNLVHMDIKPDNVFISYDDVFKLGDFGLVLDLAKKFTDAQEGDPKYLAPELMWGDFGKAADVFSLGITALELASDLDLPRNGDLWHELRSGKLPEEFLLGMSSELKKLIKLMMEPNPHNRPSIDELISLEIVRKVWQRRQRSLKRWLMVKSALIHINNMLTFAILMLLTLAHVFKDVFARVVPPDYHTPEGKGRAHAPPWDHNISDVDDSDLHMTNRSSDVVGSPLDLSSSSQHSSFSMAEESGHVPQMLDLSDDEPALISGSARSSSARKKLENGFCHPKTASPFRKRPRAIIAPKNLLKAFESLSDDNEN